MTTGTLTRPEVEYRSDAYEHICDAYRHEDGAITYIVWDDDGSRCNPREDDGNIATLVQSNDRNIAFDVPDDRIAEAHERWSRSRNTKHLVERYIAMFRPDILLYRDYWSAGQDSYGWGYVTREAWESAFYPHQLSPADAERVLAGREVVEIDLDKVRAAYDAEVKLLGQWCSNEVYGAWHVTVGDPIVVYGDHGAYIDGYREDEDSCWGFLGYDDHKDITEQFTDSPITEVLA